MKRGHQRKLQTSDWAESDSPDTGEGDDTEDFVYQPPSPATMEVGVSLESGKNESFVEAGDVSAHKLPRGNSSLEGSPYMGPVQDGRAVSPLTLPQNGNGNGRGYPPAMDLK